MTEQSGRYLPVALPLVAALVLLCSPLVAGGTTAGDAERATLSVPEGPSFETSWVVNRSENTTYTPTPTPAGSETPAPTATPPANATPTPTLTRTGTPSAEPNGSLVVTGLSAPDRVRRGQTMTVGATVGNPGPANATGRVEYVFAGETVRSRQVTVPAGGARAVSFRVSTANLTDESVAVGTYVHGVRNATGAGEAGWLRVSPDVDLSVSGFDAPVEVAPGDRFVVLATVSNPANTSITREVSYEFGGVGVATRTVTVAGGETREVAFAADVGRIEAAGLSVEEGVTYDHGIVTDGNADGDAVRVVDGPSADPGALAVEAFRATETLGPDETVEVNLTVRNVGGVAFEGQLAYRLDSSVVATEWTRVPVGERRTVGFRVPFAAVERAAMPLSSGTTRHGVWVGNSSLETRAITVYAPTPTPTATPRPAPTFAPSNRETATPRATVRPAATETPDSACRRGFLTRCGATPVDETTLTLIGIVTSVLGIVYEMLRGR